MGVKYIQGRSLAQIHGGGSDPEKVPVPDVNSGVNVGDPGPNVCPYPIEMCMQGFPIHRNEIMQFITVF